MKVIVIEDSSQAEIEAKIKEQGLDGPDVLIVGKVWTIQEGQPVLIENQCGLFFIEGEGKPS